MPKKIEGIFASTIQDKSLLATVEKASASHCAKPRWKLISKEIIAATPETARKIRDMQAWKYDRPLKTRRLNFLLDLLCRGEFRTCEWAIAYCAEDGITYRVNGKHSSFVLAEMDGSVNAPTVALIKYHCETLKDVADLYNSFDAIEGTRSFLDLAQSVASSSTKIADVWKTNLTLAISSICYANRGDSMYQQMTRAQRSDILIAEEPFVRWLDTILEHASNTHRYMAIMGCGATMYLTFKQFQKICNEFWLEVRDGTNPDPKRPTRRLQHWLMTGCTLGTSTAPRRNGRLNRGNNAERREAMVRSMHAWNAWRKGVYSDLRYYPDADIPTLI